MQEVDVDRNLLFAVLALRTGLVDQEALLKGMEVWAKDRSRNLGDILIEQDAIRPDRREWIEAMVTTQLEGHHNIIPSLTIPAGLAITLGTHSTVPRAPVDESATAALPPSGFAGAGADARQRSSTPDITVPMNASRDA